jgi:hypothetical protein
MIQIDKYFIILLVLLNFSSCQEKESQRTNDLQQIERFASIGSTKDIQNHTKLTKEFLDTIPDELLNQIIFNDIIYTLGNDYQKEFENFKKLSKGQQTIYSTSNVEFEVYNGGFNQYYINSSGQYAEVAVIGFETLGAIKFAELMKKANKIYNSIKNDLDKFNDGTAESFIESYKNNPFDNLDSKFYDLNDPEELSRFRIKYIRKNVNEFIK